MSSQQLHRQYQQSLADKAAQLRVAFDALCDEDSSVAQVENLHLLLHRLAGSAGTYGFPELSQQARALEQPWRVWMDAADDARHPAWRICVEQGIAFAALLEGLRATAARIEAAPGG